MAQTPAINVPVRADIRQFQKAFTDIQKKTSTLHNGYCDNGEHTHIDMTMLAGLHNQACFRKTLGNYSNR